MKITIGINGFKEYNSLEKREKFCIDSLLKIKNKNTNIELYNVCFDSENVTYDNFTTLNKLKVRSNKLIHNYFQHDGLTNEYNLRKDDIDNNQRELPSVKEIFDILASTDCDYFLFLNNDIILSNRFLKEIDDSDAYAISRMHIYDIDSLNEIPKLESYSIHGFDAFLIKKKTWLEIRNHFEDLVLGRFYWDTYFATMLAILVNTKFVNKLPPVCFHIEHGSTSSQDHIENYYNEDVFKRNLIIGHLWFNYVQNVPMKRPTVEGCKWYQPFPNEELIEKQHFKVFDVRPLTCNFNVKSVTDDTSYDLFIPLIQKDEIKLKYVYEHALKHLSPKNVYVCSPHNITNRIQGINYINDLDVVNISDKNFITFRPNWTYQQFLKLFFKGQSSYYFALDCDTIILKDLPLFKNKHPIWYYGWKQNHFPYFLFNRRVFNLKKSLNHTGIGDLGLFNQNIIESFLHSTGCRTPEELLKNIGGYTNSVFHFSEYETYANFVDQYYPGLYGFEHLEQLNEGRDLNQGQDWNNNDIVDIIDKASKTDKSILSIHSWKI